ncbi:MAG: CinA family nicotinamide mononucleotide deamidase-related protein [Candidatus Hydrogenedentes bacterium]|nr:CinA family nicotinamide mononucleotide deamidase-related protein [Candidatus Hydrogenedentota bacterium]
MKTELLMIGSELLLGQIQDTNSTYISQALAEHGIGCYLKTTVGDNKERIMAMLDAGLDRSDVILCSGGLGPTEDDITRECIGELLGLPLEFRAALYESILERYSNVKRLFTENNKKQATLPRGATVVENPNGTAPGVIVDSERGIIICMPGVPHELKAMLDDSVIPYLKARFNISGTVVSRVLKVCGMGESSVDDLIGDLMASATNPTIGLLASPESVRIRITAKADDEAHAHTLIEPVAKQVYERLPGRIMGENDDVLEAKVATLLRERGLRLAIIDCATGGMIAQRLLQADPEILVEGRVLSPGQAPTDPNSMLDYSRKQMLKSPVNCILVCPSPSEEGIVPVILHTPQNEYTWEITALGSGARAQVRLTVGILESIRRELITSG